MKRLTVKDQNGFYAVKMPKCKNNEEAKPIFMQNFKDCCAKLGKIEDIEEHIGMPADVYIKLHERLVEHIYIIDEDQEIRDCFLIDYRSVLEVCHYFEFDDEEVHYHRELQDYGKTWWFEKEEAEKELSKIRGENLCLN